MMTMQDTVFTAGAGGLAELYRTGACDPVAVTARYLDRIARLDRALGAMVAVDRIGAKAAAAYSRVRWQFGEALSPLDGVPIAVKANIAVAGLPWTAGIGAYDVRVADRDAACVARLRAAGAVILGLTNMDEGALGALGDNQWLGRCHNPYRPDYTPGGSSGGSAVAVAAGFCAAALGTDTIGSVRIPASYCGVFGHKPRQALISREGVCPLSPSFDHVGVLGRSAEDCAAILQGLGSPPAPPGSIESLRVAVLDTSADASIPTEVAAAIAGIARAAGAVPIRLEFDFARIRRLLLIVAEVEAAAVHGEMLRARPDGFSDGFARLLRWGEGEGRSRYDAALAGIAAAAAQAEIALAGYDALLLPATPRVAFAQDGPVPDDQADSMALATALGWPATAFPAGAIEGLPIGAQVIARDDATSLAVAGALAVR